MKTISLTRGQVAIIDDADYEVISKYKWHAHKPHSKSDIYYAAKNPGGGGRSKFVSMHRLIASAAKGIKVDHKDGNGLNNQRHNLRCCTHAQNLANSRALRKTNTSGFVGVSWCSAMNKWRAKIHVKGKELVLGYFDNPAEAAKVYDVAIVAHYGEFAKPNSALQGKRI